MPRPSPTITDDEWKAVDDLLGNGPRPNVVGAWRWLCSRMTISRSTFEKCLRLRRQMPVAVPLHASAIFVDAAIPHAEPTPGEATAESSPMAVRSGSKRPAADAVATQPARGVDAAVRPACTEQPEAAHISEPSFEGKRRQGADGSRTEGMTGLASESSSTLRVTPNIEAAATNRPAACAQVRVCARAHARVCEERLRAGQHDAQQRGVRV